MTKEPTVAEEMYEEWIAHPDLRAYVHKSDHESYASRRGWWCHGETTLTSLSARGVKPVARVRKATT